MDAVQKQIVALSHKIDALYQVTEQLNSKISAALPEGKQPLTSETDPAATAANVRPRAYQSQTRLESVMDHKDILVEGSREAFDLQQSSEKPLSADVQVQRLTAQLTAAYNRIAALEEQLLARRIHS